MCDVMLSLAMGVKVNDVDADAAGDAAAGDGDAGLGESVDVDLIGAESGDADAADESIDVVGMADDGHCVDEDRLRRLPAKANKAGKAGNASQQQQQQQQQQQEQEPLNLLDLLRTRASSDDRPLVRAKALQAFGVAMTLAWPRKRRCKNSHSLGLITTRPSLPLPIMHDVSTTGEDDDNEEEEEEEEEEMSVEDDTDDSVSMLVTSEDIAVLVGGCGDESLAARKQAVAALTALCR